jgi:phosphatidylglycerol:prolipoprotein diacylglycerol transferase
VLGQVIGRWANFFNREVFGDYTDSLLAMRLPLEMVRQRDISDTIAAHIAEGTNYIQVHPTFLYESLWNLVGLLLILFVLTRGRRFDGENTWFYFLWYGVGRFWIEGLRTDSLYLFDWTILGQPIRVSQALSAVMAIVAAFMLFYNIKIKKKTADGLWVNQLAAAKAAEAAAAKAAKAAEVENPELMGFPIHDEITEETEYGDQN